MAGDFGTMVARIASELRRSNLTTEIKAAVNDAINDAAKTRFYFNEVRGLNFVTVNGTEYYPDQGLVEIDAIYYRQGGGARINLTFDNNIFADRYAAGNVTSGQPDVVSRQGTDLRIYPVPAATIYTIYMDGYGKLTPYPLVNDADTNNWMTYGEQYIRALAKSTLLKDVIRDYSEASVLEAIAEDYKAKLDGETALRLGTGTLNPTQF